MLPPNLYLIYWDVVKRLRQQTLTLPFGGSNPSIPRSVYSKPPRGTDWVTLIAIIILVDVNIDGVRIC